MNKRVAHNKLSQEDVITQFKEVHGDEFDYSKVVYINTNTPVEVYCRKHDFIFTPTPKNHKNGAKCTHCGREEQIKKAKKGLEQFIKEVKVKYGDKYDYSLVEYINSKTPVKIIDKGKVFKILPSSILQNKKQKEFIKKLTRSTDKDTFIREALKIYKDKDDYTNTNIISSKDSITVKCKVHNISFTKSIQNYLSGCGCPKCSAENYSKLRKTTTEEFVKASRLIHGNSCDYTDTIHNSVKEKVTIKCNIHNIYFTTLPFNHLKGGKCRQCLSENISNALKGKEGTCGYTKTRYINQAKEREAYVYLIRCWNEEEEFYKIGKTFLQINKRFTKSNICYNFEVIHKHIGEAGYVYDLENTLQREYKTYKHRPKKWFAGHTECFNTDLPIDEIIAL
jgi:hypothetical protein